MTMQDRCKTVLLFAGLTAIAFALGLSGFPSCPVYFISGISCAGCGMSRAWLATLSGNLNQAFYYHPLFWLPPIALAVYILGNKLPKKTQTIFLYIYISVFAIVYTIRLLNPNDTVVLFTPENNIMHKALTFLKTLAVT